MAVFVPDPAGIERVKETPQLIAYLKMRAGRMRDAAAQAAPVGSGRYRRSLKVWSKGRRVKVTTRDPAGHIIEWGSVNNPAYAPLRTGASRAGFALGAAEVYDPGDDGAGGTEE